ncbi:MAG: hypothetical protein M1368_03235, partial [Thaumarchaeota archaeon]|nr:hypothetical protein [Nitrososphaerota archaeon]
QVLERLIEILNENSHFSTVEVLNAWKEQHHVARANEPYAWRAAIEEIKNSDLSVKCAKVDAESRTIITDKPTMLKIAGEITNSLLHSYSTRHKVTFGQYVSNDPS